MSFSPVCPMSYASFCISLGAAGLTITAPSSKSLFMYSTSMPNAVRAFCRDTSLLEEEALLVETTLRCCRRDTS